MQVFTQKKNPITGDTEWDVQHENYDYHQEIARSAFADMLHDHERNRKYEEALKLAIQTMHNNGKRANVLDIGKQFYHVYLNTYNIHIPAINVLLYNTNVIPQPTPMVWFLYCLKIIDCFFGKC